MMDRMKEVMKTWTWSDGYDQGFVDGAEAAFWRGVGFGFSAASVIAGVIVWLL
jgi:hypothetical protein